jgi:hypothetical protein
MRPDLCLVAPRPRRQESFRLERLKSGNGARLPRAQTFLRALGIDITFSRGGRDGSRTIRMRAHSKISSAPSWRP